MKTQLLGKFRIDRVVESEGPFAALEMMLPGITTGDIDAHADWLKPLFVAPDNRAIMSFHSYILKTPHHTILIDACVGNDKDRPERPTWHRQRFAYLEAMAAVGVRPEDIDFVCCTHLHADHVGWNTRLQEGLWVPTFSNEAMAAVGVRPEDIDFVCCTHLHADHVGWNTRLQEGRWVPTFSNARYVFARTEYEHWERMHRQSIEQGLPVLNHGSFADSVLPVVDAGRALMVGDDFEFESGVYLQAAPGHTPGNCTLHAVSEGKQAVFSGDILHTPAQLINPAWSSRFCVDPVQSAATRTRLVHELSDTATLLLSGHFPTPVAGRVVSRGDHFRFDCVER